MPRFCLVLLSHHHSRPDLVCGCFCWYLLVRFPPDYTFTSSRFNLCKDLIYMLFPAPMHRTVYYNLSGQDVLMMLLSPSTETFFVTLHSAVKAWRHSQNVFVSSVNGRLCDVPETIEHCFINCKDAILFWDVLRRTLRKDFELTRYGIRYLDHITRSKWFAIWLFFFLIALRSLWKLECWISTQAYGFFHITFLPYDH